jgi:hypothetical protein
VNCTRLEALHRGAAWLLLAAALACAAGCGGARPAAAHVSAWHGAGQADKPSASEAVRLRLEATGAHWYGKPLYRVCNTAGPDLHRVTVYSWSEAALPVVRTEAPSSRARENGQRRVDGPPYDLPAGGCLYVVGPHEPPLKVTVVWLGDDGHTRYQVVRSDR